MIPPKPPTPAWFSTILCVVTLLGLLRLAWWIFGWRLWRAWERQVVRRIELEQHWALMAELRSFGTTETTRRALLARAQHHAEEARRLADEIGLGWSRRDIAKWATLEELEAEHRRRARIRRIRRLLGASA